jgi:hypothetical protein
LINFLPKGVEFNEHFSNNNTIDRSLKIITKEYKKNPQLCIGLNGKITILEE